MSSLYLNNFQRNIKRLSIFVMVLDAVCLLEGGGCAMQSVKPPTQPDAWARPGLLLTWGAPMAFWNSVSFLDKKLAVSC